MRILSLVVLALVLPLWAFAQNLPVPTNLTAEGIPAIPMALYERLGQYGEYRTAGLLDWHPVNREMLISTRFADVPQIHRVTMPGGARTQLTFFPDRVAGGRYQPVTGESFLFSKDTGGGEFYQIYRFDVKTGRTTLLTDGKSRNMAVTWSRDGSRIAYASTKRDGQDTDIYVMDPANPASARLLVEVQGGGWAPVDWSPDGKKLLVVEEKSVNESAAFLVDPVSGAKDRITPADPPAYYAAAEFAADGKSLYVITDRESDFLRLARLDLTSRKFTFFAARHSARLVHSGAFLGTAGGWPTW